MNEHDSRINSSKNQGPKRQGFVGRFPSIQIGCLNPSFSTHLADYAASAYAILVLLQNNLLLSVVQFMTVNHPYTFFCKEGYCGHIWYLRLCGIQQMNISNNYDRSEKGVYPVYPTNPWRTTNSIANQVTKQTLILITF